MVTSASTSFAFDLAAETELWNKTEPLTAKRLETHGSSPEGAAAVFRDLNRDLAAGKRVFKNRWPISLLLEYLRGLDRKMNSFAHPNDRGPALQAAKRLTRFYPSVRVSKEVAEETEFDPEDPEHVAYGYAVAEQQAYAHLIARLYKQGGDWDSHQKWEETAKNIPIPSFSGAPQILVRGSRGSVLAHGSMNGSLVVVGTVAEVKPRQRMVQVYSHDAPPVLMTHGEYKQSKKGGGRHIFYTDVVIKVRKTHQAPPGMASPVNVIVRTFGVSGRSLFAEVMGERVQLEAEFKPGEKVLLYLTEDALLGHVGPAHWKLTQGIFGKFTQDHTGAYVQNGDLNYGGGSIIRLDKDVAPTPAFRP